MYSSGMFFVYLFSSALAFALVNRVLRHRLTWLSALSDIYFRVIILSPPPFFSAFMFLPR